MLSFDPAFLAQPIDVVLYDILTWFGWMPIAITIVMGFIQLWKHHRQGLFDAALKHVVLAIDVPAMTEQTPKAVESLFVTLTGAYSKPTWKETWIFGKFQPTFSFEIVSTDGYVQFYVRTQTKFRDAVEAGIYAQYPDAEITEVEDYTQNFPRHFPNDTHEMWGSEFDLKESEIFPIRTYKDFEDSVVKEYKDPLGQTLEQLAKMRPGENYWVQILCQAINNDWKEAGIKFINKIYGIEKPHAESGFAAGARTLLSIPDAVLAKTIGVNLSGMLLGPSPKAKEQDQWKAFKLTPSDIEQTKAVLGKISKPGFMSKIRIVYIAKKEAYNKGARVLFIKGMFTHYSHLNLNRLAFSIPTIPRDDYFWQKWSYATKQSNLMTGYVNRSMSIGGTPKVMNTEELATLWHFPAIGIKAPLIKKVEARRGEAPVGLPIDMGGEDVVARGTARMAAMRQKEEAAAAQGHAPAGDHVDIELPHPTLPTDAAPAAPREEDEEKELGLDATDMGPAADVELPGPPPGWREELASAPDVEDRDNDGSHEGVPPVNLPV